MTEIEQVELDRHAKQIKHDVKNLVKKYRRIFDWDVPENDEDVANKLILAAIRKALDDM